MTILMEPSFLIMGISGDDQCDREGSIMTRVSSSSKDCWKPFSVWAGMV